MADNPLFGDAPLGGGDRNSDNRRGDWSRSRSSARGPGIGGIVWQSQVSTGGPAPRWSKFDFGDARVALAGGQSASRDAIRSVLVELRFREIDMFDSVEAISRHMGLVPLDLLIADVDLAGGDICEVIRAVRHGERLGNPFLPIILMTWEPTADVVNRVSSAGADALIALPMSRERLLDALEGLVNRRKPFVVTTDYVGPDRRSKPRPGSQEIPLIEVPNTLRAKAIGQKEKMDPKACLAVINEQKVERHAFQVGYLVREITDQYERHPESFAPLTGRLRRVTADLCRRIESTRYSHQAALAGSLLTLVEGIVESGSISPRDIELLSQLSLALQIGFNNDDETVVAAHGIVDTLQSRSRPSRRS